MPEGHTLHRLARALSRAFVGTTPVVTSPQGRFDDGAARLSGRRVESAEAWGKHLFVTFEGDLILNVHLGLIGIFDVNRYVGGPGAEPPPVGAVRVRIRNEEWVADLRGATVVELVTPDLADATVSRLGPDPLRAGTAGNDPSRSLARLKRTSRPVAELLMDQAVVAGVGNVYRSEVLFRHRVNPFVPGTKVRPKTWVAMWDDLVELMPIGVAFGQIITLDDQLEQARTLLATGDHTAYEKGWQGFGEGERGRRPAYESEGPLPREYAVYQRAGMPCLVCGSKVRTALVAGRNLFWCGRDQRRH